MVVMREVELLDSHGQSLPYQVTMRGCVSAAIAAASLMAENCGQLALETAMILLFGVFQVMIN
ncbi:MAG: hypothetical protein GY696_22285 [Gammaproteobacteria bacterium]|nr:hypothetical protein [Gammaproteobacteria bacterium]